jgi:putative CocE/NonD family hydrolase
VFTGEPLNEPLTVIGMVRAQVSVASTAPSVDVAVKLCDVEPDGRSLNVVDSVSRLHVSPGESVLLDVAVGSTAYRFRPGHRLRVIVSGSNFPRFDLNPEHAAEHTVRWGDGTGSRLVLPLTTSL